MATFFKAEPLSSFIYLLNIEWLDRPHQTRNRLAVNVLRMKHAAIIIQQKLAPLSDLSLPVHDLTADRLTARRIALALDTVRLIEVVHAIEGTVAEIESDRDCHQTGPSCTGIIIPSGAAFTTIAIDPRIVSAVSIVALNVTPVSVVDVMHVKTDPFAAPPPTRVASLLICVVHASVPLSADGPVIVRAEFVVHTYTTKSPAE